MAEVEIYIKEVFEGSDFIATAAFTDENGAAFTPTEVYVRLDCKTTGEAIRAEGLVNPVGSTMDIPIAASESDIHDDANEYEEHEITIRATYGAGKELTGRAVWKVNNLAFLA